MIDLILDLEFANNEKVYLNSNHVTSIEESFDEGRSYRKIITVGGHVFAVKAEVNALMEIIND